MELHYNTQRIITRVENNQNTEALLLDTALVLHTDHEPQDPVPVRELADHLDHIFKAGAEISLETNTDFADEGGDCYIAYIVKPKWKQSFHDYVEENMERGGANYNLAIMEYITGYPTHFYQLWAGPY